jgi:hypothetical protein
MREVESNLPSVEDVGTHEMNRLHPAEEDLYRLVMYRLVIEPG